MRAETFQLAAEDGHEIHGTRWLPTEKPRAVLQLFHGLGEHHQRYVRFAGTATERGFAVVAHDHRGHGPSSDELGFFAASDGWQKLLADGHRVRMSIHDEFGNRPQVLIGHSMGSYIAQAYAMQFPDDQDMLALSASTWAGTLIPTLGHTLARFEAWRTSDYGRSPIMNALGFGSFNIPFRPARTPLDWLSRDSDEVDAYIADPLCGGPYTCSLWKDLTQGMRSITSHEALLRIPRHLPLLLTGGSDDPVGGERGITKLGQHYEATTILT